MVIIVIYVSMAERRKLHPRPKAEGLRRN